MNSTASSSEHDRTEPATQQRLSEARKQGQVPKSLDVNAFIMVAAMFFALLILAAGIWSKLAITSEQLMAFSGQSSETESAAIKALEWTAKTFWQVISIPLCVGCVSAIAGNLLQTGANFSPEAIRPNFSRLNPIAGLKKIFNKRIFLEALKSIIKLLILIAITFYTFQGKWTELVSVVTTDVVLQIAWLGKIVSTITFRLILALAAFAAIDWAMSRYQYAKSLRMSHRDIREEVRRREGDPQIRSKIRQLQKENLKQSKSIGRVAEADVLITNPTHYAVALKYIRGQMSAPHVIAKGSDKWAKSMRILADRHAVHVMERKHLARQLFTHGKLDKPVPVDSFVDVARLYHELNEQKRSKEIQSGILA